MPTYREIRDWVLQNHGSTVESCWVAPYKAITFGYQRLHLNQHGAPRKQPCSMGALRDAIVDAFNAIGVPNGRRHWVAGAQK